MSLSRTQTLLVQSAAVNNFTKRLKNSVDINWRREANYDSQSAVQQETSNHRASHSNWVKILQSAIRRQATAVWGCVTHQILQVLPGVFVDQHKYFSVSVATETRVRKETGGIFQPCLLQRKQVFGSKVFIAEPTQRRHEREIWNQTNKQKVATKKRTKCNQLMFIMAVDCLNLVTIHSQMIREDFQFIELKKEETSLHPAAHHTHHSDLRGTRDWSCQTDAGEIWSKRTE